MRLAILLLLLPVLANASTIILDTREESFAENAEGLKRTHFIVQNYKVVLPEGENFGTRLFAEYETTALEDLERYVWVQWIRGCHFDACAKPGEPVTRSLSYARRYFGELITFIHPTWMIDSDDTDPAYNSMVEDQLPRHYAYRWNTVPNSYDNRTEKYFGRQKPKTPKLYVADHPGQAFTWGTQGCAKNLSEEFKVCLYREQDVPVTADPKQTEFLGPPVRCFDWASTWIYDFERAEFAHSAEIDPFCLGR